MNQNYSFVNEIQSDFSSDSNENIFKSLMHEYE